MSIDIINRDTAVIIAQSCEFKTALESMSKKYGFRLFILPQITELQGDDKWIRDYLLQNKNKEFLVAIDPDKKFQDPTKSSIFLNQKELKIFNIFRKHFYLID